MEDSELEKLTVALLNAMGREGCGDGPTKVVLILAFGESGIAKRSRNQLMRWRRGEMSGLDLAREPGLGERRDYRLGEMPMPVRPIFSAQPLFRLKISRDGSAPSHSAILPSAALPSKKVKRN